MNETAQRHYRRMDAQRLLMRAGVIVLVTAFVVITLLLMDAGIQDARLS